MVCATILFTILTVNAAICAPVARNGRFLVFTFALLQSQFLLSLYQGWVLSVLISRDPPAPVNNVDQLLTQLASGQSRLVVSSSGNWFYDSLMHSHDYQFVRIREALVNNPVVRSRSFGDSLLMIQQQSDLAMPSELDSLMEYGAGMCDVVIFPADLTPVLGVLILTGVVFGIAFIALVAEVLR